MIGLEPAAIRKSCGVSGGSSERADDLQSSLAGARDERPHSVTGAQHTRLRLEQAEGDVADLEAREQGLRLRRRQALDGNAGGLECRLAVALPAAVVVGEPDGAGLDEDPGAQLAPLRERSIRKFCVKAIRSVRVAQHPRLAAGLGARVARLESVDERDVPAVADEPVGEGRAEDPASDDDHGRHAANG